MTRPLFNARWIIPIFILVLTFTLSARGMNQTTAVRAAPPAQQGTFTNMRFYLNVVNPGTLCAGHDYPLRVTPLAELQGDLMGQKFDQKDKIIPGVEIAAEIGPDQSIATIDPAKQSSGNLPGNLLETHLFKDQEKLGRLGEVVFTLHAKKAGTTNLYLTAEVPKRWSGSTKKYFGPSGLLTGGPIKIVNCKYRVIAEYWWEFSGQGFRTWNFGRLDTTITATADPQYYGGDGSFNFMLSHFDLTCQRRTGHQMPTHITASPNFVTDQLELTFTIGTPSGTVTDTCPNSFLLAHAAFEDSDAPWRGKPISLPLSGGTKSLTLHAPHPGIPNAKVTISVQPIIETGVK